MDGKNKFQFEMKKLHDDNTVLKHTLNNINEKIAKSLKELEELKHNNQSLEKQVVELSQEQELVDYLNENGDEDHESKKISLLKKKIQQKRKVVRRIKTSINKTNKIIAKCEEEIAQKENPSIGKKKKQFSLLRSLRSLKRKRNIAMNKLNEKNENERSVGSKVLAFLVSGCGTRGGKNEKEEKRKLKDDLKKRGEGTQ